jgi:hypothetical protein
MAGIEGDFRNLFSLEDVKESGLIYHSLGRARQTGSRSTDRVVLIRAH